MDKDNLFKALIAALLACVVWNLLTQAFLPQQPPPASQQEVATADHEADPAARAPRDMKARGLDAEQFIELGSTDPNIKSPFSLALTLSNRGAAMVSARLRDHYETISKEQFYPIISSVKLKDETLLYSFVTESINLRRGEESFQLDQLYWHAKRELIDGTERAVFWIEFFRQGEDQPIGRLTKTYILRAPSDQETPDALTAPAAVQMLVYRIGSLVRRSKSAIGCAIRS